MEPQPGDAAAWAASYEEQLKRKEAQFTKPVITLTFPDHLKTATPHSQNTYTLRALLEKLVVYANSDLKLLDREVLLESGMKTSKKDVEDTRLTLDMIYTLNGQIVLDCVEDLKPLDYFYKDKT